MDSAELTRFLRDATSKVEPRQGFAAAVVRGSKRRKARHRVVIITGATAVTALAAGTTYAAWPDPHPGVTQLADPRLKAPTTGDLAGDQAFLNDAARAWRDGLPHSWNFDRGIFDDLHGTPHVYWAGTTPAGPAAVVIQEAYFHQHGNLSPDQFGQTQTLVGLVARDPADGVLKLVYDQYQASGFGPAGYFQFGPGDRTVLVVAQDTPLYFSPAPIAGPDGRVTRAWQPLAVRDGVAIAEAPEGTDPTDLRLVARATPPAPDDKGRDGLLYLGRSSDYLRFAKDGVFPTATPADDPRLPWRDPAAALIRIGRQFAGVPDEPREFWSQATEAAGLTDMGTNIVAPGGWHILAGLPDGRAILVSELSVDNQPSRIYAVVLKPGGGVERGIRGDLVDKKATLPVRLHLPDGLGWIVADYPCSLRYRTGSTAPWQPATANAALLPEVTTQVQVTKPGKDPQVINLAP